jgi:leucine-rich repeat protein SHOC2
MTPAELEKIILTEQCDRLLQYRLYESNLPQDLVKVVSLYWLCLANRQITSIPDNIGNFIYFTKIDLSHNQLTSLPESFSKIANLIELNICNNQFTNIPDSIASLTNLAKLDLSCNQLTEFPESIGSISNLLELDLSCNQLTYLPVSLRNLIDLRSLSLSQNKISSLERQLELECDRLDTLPKQLDLGFDRIIKISSGLVNLKSLEYLNLNDNPLTDLSVLQCIPTLQTVAFFDVYLPRRYWTKLSEWKPEWLLDEDNVEIRRALIEQVGYEKICEALNAVTIDSWREYTLLKIDGVEKIYDDEEVPNGLPSATAIDTEPMILLKMTCPSTAHIHILRVPPEMESAEAAIVWVNHGIHPDKFAVQT